MPSVPTRDKCARMGCSSRGPGANDYFTGKSPAGWALGRLAARGPPAHILDRSTISAVAVASVSPAPSVILPSITISSPWAMLLA